MRRIAALMIGVSITAIGMYGEDNMMVGTWKYNPAKSKTASANPVKSQTDVREATPDGRVNVTRTAQLADGTAINYSFAYKYDGKENPVTGARAPWDTISVKRVNANTISWEVKKADGTYHATGRNVLSKDGKTITQTGKGTDAKGKPSVVTMVFDKQ